MKIIVCPGPIKHKPQIPTATDSDCLRARPGINGGARPLGRDFGDNEYNEEFRKTQSCIARVARAQFFLNGQVLVTLTP